MNWQYFTLQLKHTNYLNKQNRLWRPGHSAVLQTDVLPVFSDASCKETTYSFYGSASSNSIQKQFWEAIIIIIINAIVLLMAL